MSNLIVGINAQGYPLASRVKGLLAWLDEEIVRFEERAEILDNAGSGFPTHTEHVQNLRAIRQTIENTFRDLVY